MTDDAGCFRVTAGNLTNGLGLWYQRTAEIYHAAAKITSASTYQCEFAIPWDSETFKPGVNQKVGLEIQLNVNTVGDDKRYSVVEWSEPEECLAWNSTAYMSVCELIGEPAPDPVIDPTPAVTPDAPPTFDPQVLFGALTAVSAAGILLTRKRKH